MPSYTTPPKTWTTGATVLASDMNTYVRDAFESMFPIGTLIHIVQGATSVETLINSVWLECNGTAVSRSTYSTLNTLLSGLSYPFGSGDGSTTFNLPDLRGRTLIHHSTSSGNAATKSLGLSDSAALASRTPKPSVSVSISVSGTTGSHTHSMSSSGAGAGSVGTLVAAGNTGSATATFAGSGSGSGTATTAFLVAGIYAIKAFT